MTLAALGRGDPRGERAELFESHDAEATHSRDQSVKNVDRGASIVQSAVIRGCRGAEQPCQRAELAVGGLVLADELSSQMGRVDDVEGRPAVTGDHGCSLEEGDVEGRIVSDKNAVAGELEKSGEHAADPW